MTSVNISIGELLGIILAIAGLNWLIMTLAIASVKTTLLDIKEDIGILFTKSEKTMTKEDCDDNMKNCKELREARDNAHTKHTQKRLG